MANYITLTYNIKTTFVLIQQNCSLQYFDLDVNALGFTIEGAAAENGRGWYLNRRNFVFITTKSCIINFYLLCRKIENETGSGGDNAGSGGSKDTTVENSVAEIRNELQQCSLDERPS